MAGMSMSSMPTLSASFFGLGPGEELRRDGKGVLERPGRDAVTGDHEKPGVIAGAGDGACE